MFLLCSINKFRGFKPFLFFFTFAFLLFTFALFGDIKNVAKNNKLATEEVESMLKNIAEKIIPIHVDKLRILGIDEISLVKGQGKFIVVLVDLETLEKGRRQRAEGRRNN